MEWFSRLKEYESLMRLKQDHLKAINEQDLRLKQISLRKDDTVNKLNELKADYIQLQQKLKDIEARIALLSQQKQRLIDLGSDDSKIKPISEEIAKLEDEGFVVLEKIEVNETERADAQTFIEGVSRTISEINDEVQLDIKNHQTQISQLQTRLELLLDMLPEDFKSTLQRVLKKNLVHGPFTRIESGSCMFCRYKISRTEESEIDMQKQLKLCPQCSRIFIPYGT